MNWGYYTIERYEVLAILSGAEDIHTEWVELLSNLNGILNVAV